MRRALFVLSFLALGSGCGMPPATAAAPIGGAAPAARPDATPIPPPPPAEPAAPDAPSTASAGLPETKSGEEKPADHAPPARAAAEAPDDDRKKAELGRPMPKGSAAPGAAVATGATLPPAVVQKVVQSHMRDVKRCRERASGSGAAIEGKLLLAITVDDRGAVTNAVATTSTVPAELSQCVAALTRAWTFPPPDGGGTVVVNYPFTFSTKE